MSLNKDEEQAINLLENFSDEDSKALEKGAVLLRSNLPAVCNQCVIDLGEKMLIKEVADDMGATRQAEYLQGFSECVLDLVESPKKNIIECVNQNVSRFGVAAIARQVCGSDGSEIKYIELYLAACKQIIGKRWSKKIAVVWNDLLKGVFEFAEKELSESSSSRVLSNETVANGEAVIYLQGVQDVSKSQALKNEFVVIANQYDSFEIDAQNVERIDASTIQLLCALFEYARHHNIEIRWSGCSPAFLEAANILGAGSVLGVAE